MRYVVFGCDDTNWATTYQCIPTLLDEKLAKKGATRLIQKGPMLDLLKKYPACELSFERFIELLSPLKTH